MGSWVRHLRSATWAISSTPKDSWEGGTPREAHVGRNRSEYGAKERKVTGLGTQKHLFDDAESMALRRREICNRIAHSRERHRDRNNKSHAQASHQVSRIPVGTVVARLRQAGSKYNTKFLRNLFVVVDSGRGSLSVERLDGRRHLLLNPSASFLFSIVPLTCERIIAFLHGSRLSKEEVSKRMAELVSLGTLSLYPAYNALALPSLRISCKELQIKFELASYNFDGMFAAFRDPARVAIIESISRANPKVIYFQETKIQTKAEKEAAALFETIFSDRYIWCASRRSSGTGEA